MTNIITIDGPSGSGKGTVSRILAKKLSYDYLDSGALYRLLGIAAMRSSIDLSDTKSLAEIAEQMEVEFQLSTDGKFKVTLDGDDVTSELRLEDTGALASQIAAYGLVRRVLLTRQRAFATGVGLVADGRDMGTVVFPDAELKIYLTASVEQRTNRRYKELLEKGEDVSLRALAEQVRARDERDMNRAESPLVAADDAIELDSSHMSIDEVVEAIMAIIEFKRAT
ncbi:(d)CMP kinase [Porticoccaceae bacterium]|nr:(d)CMP kinase [Porticoccaceae bacterium]MDA8664262.1 (d)CMP kinase [Porticoccaceae bacterium]